MLNRLIFQVLGTVSEMLRCGPSTNSMIRPIELVRTALCPASSAAVPTKQSLSRLGRPNIVLVDAVRTPFVQSGTLFKDMISNDLQRAALLG